jgi:ABC-type Fe3+-hydroxamate transport system substrate-binding protein
VLDDLGAVVRVGGSATRVVSLVPSLTEAIAATRPDALVGATDWCTRPATLAVARVRGTKNPNLGTVVGLRPDLVVANREENREIDVRRLRAAGVPVWVTVVETVPQAIASMTRLFRDALGWGVPPWLAEVRRRWDRPVPPAAATVAVPVWRDPWMVVGRDTFTGDLLARLGFANAFGGTPERYPHVALADIDRAAVDVVLLPDEPYPFGPDDGPEAFTTSRPVLVDGRALTWYGPSMLDAEARLRAATGQA